MKLDEILGVSSPCYWFKKGHCTFVEEPVNKDTTCWEANVKGVGQICDWGVRGSASLAASLKHRGMSEKL